MLKDLGSIALFLGIFLNAYHYYKLHIWSKKEKNFDMIMKIVDELKTIRNAVLDIDSKRYSLSNEISQYTDDVIVADLNAEIVPKIEGKPSRKLCLELSIFEQNTLKVYQDYMFVIKLKNAMQTEKIVDEPITQEFIQELQDEIQNRLTNLFVTFCWWDKTMNNHGIPYGIMEQFANCENIENLFKGIK
jgi:hypothetical protein